jgi:hypothetical protein
LNYTARGLHIFIIRAGWFDKQTPLTLDCRALMYALPALRSAAADAVPHGLARRHAGGAARRKPPRKVACMFSYCGLCSQSPAEVTSGAAPSRGCGVGSEELTGAYVGVDWLSISPLPYPRKMNEVIK